MTTFTLQDLTPDQQDTEALQSMAKLGGGVDINVLLDGHVGIGKAEALAKHEAMHAVYALGQTIADNTRLEAQAGTLDAPEPQPTPDLDSIINTICTQLQLLSTVIRAQGATPPEGNQSLQETIALTLQQADWFKEMVEKAVDDLDMVEIAKEAVEGVVESEVEHYFTYRFNPEEHFDFGDAISNEVHDRIDDVVRDHIDGAVDEYMSGATITISK
jgi:hypothetical protein